MSSPYAALANVPNGDEDELVHEELEARLIERALASQPDRAKVGYTEVVIRDIATSVVRELVGIFEALLDRLLVDKKQGTIRDMVIELVTEDARQLIATSADELKKLELDQLTKELERLGAEGKSREAAWEERFRLVDDLRESQDDLYTTLDERCRLIEERLTQAERSAIPREELQEMSRDHAVSLEALRSQADRVEQRLTTLTSQHTELEAHCRDSYAAKDELQRTAQHLNVELAARRKEMERGLSELQGQLLSRRELEETKSSMEDRMAKHSADLAAAQEEVRMLHNAVSEGRQRCDDTFVTKQDHTSARDGLEANLQALKEQVQANTQGLETTKASKQDLEKTWRALVSELREQRQRLDEVGTAGQSTAGRLGQLEDRIQSDFITKAVIDESQKSMVEHVLKQTDSREEFAKIRRELEADRERFRNAHNQQQTTRKDLNEAVEDIQGLRQSSNELKDVYGKMVGNIKALDTREATHWDQNQEQQRALDNTLEELRTAHGTLQGEFKSQTDSQRAETEKLQKQSTERYFEQVDRALNLAQSVERVEKDHRELNESVRSIRLPPVGSVA